MSKKESVEPVVDVVENSHDAAAYNRQQEAHRDTTDNGWGNGVYADQEDQTVPRAVPAAGVDSGKVPDLRRTRTETPREPEPEQAVSPLFLAVGVTAAVVAIGAALALALGWV